MALSWTTAAQAQLAKSTVRPAVFLRIQATSVLRMWGGSGDFPVPEDAVETEADAIYTGMGEVTGWPAVQQLINGLAERVDFILSGIPANLVAIASNEAATVRNAPCSLGFMVLGGPNDAVGAWQPVSPMAWVWYGTCDVLKIARQASGDRITRSITLSVGSLMTARQRPAMDYWTDADQRQASPTDSFCDHVASYSAQITKRFKPRS